MRRPVKMRSLSQRLWRIQPSHIATITPANTIAVIEAPLTIGAVASLHATVEGRKGEMMPSPPSQSNATFLRVLSWPLIMVGFLVALIESLVKGGLAAGVTFWFVFIAALYVWGFKQHRRAQQQIRSQLERSGCKVVKMNYRHLRIGPFSHWNSSRSQLVYRAIVQDATGRERIIWARWGRRWYWDPDTLELKWEE